MGKKMNPPISGENLPELQKFSDIAAEQILAERWNTKDGRNFGFNLTYIIYAAVENQPVLDIVSRVLNSTGKSLEK